MKRTADFRFHSARLALRSELHLVRKLWHMSMGMVIALIYLAGLPVLPSLVILSTAFALSVAVEFGRLRNPEFNQRMIRMWGPVMRSSEIQRVSGIPFYLAATIVAIAVFPKPVAVLSILYLACGDPIASVFGILYGDRGPRFANGKSLIGTAAGVITCLLVSWIYLQTLNLPPAPLAALTLVGGISGGTAELLPLEADDNFTIPVVSGFVLWLAFILLGL